MKSYSKDVKISDDKKKKLNKQKIKDSLRLLLAQALIEYKMNIKEWHYFIISYYNPDKNYYNQDIIDTCKEEGLEYLFYNPKTHYFYDKNFFKIEGEIKLSFNSNLDYNRYNSPELIFENFHNIDSNIYKYCSISSLQKKLQEKATKFIKLVNNDETLIGLNRKIKIKLEGIKSLKLISIYYYSKNYPFPIPNESYLLLIINKICDDYIYYYKKNNNYFCGLVLAEKEDKFEPVFLPGYVNSEILSYLVYKLD